MFAAGMKERPPSQLDHYYETCCQPEGVAVPPIYKGLFPECLVGVFCGLRVNGVLGSSPKAADRLFNPATHGCHWLDGQAGRIIFLDHRICSGCAVVMRSYADALHSVWGH